MIDQAASFSLAMLRFAASGFKVVRPETYAARMEQCGPCPKNKAGFCDVCDCYLEAKTHLPFEACPEGKWSEEND